MTRNSKKTVAFFGGAFDPPHRGHRAVCQWLSQPGDFDSFWVAPADAHPFQKKLAPFDDRMAMCRGQFGDVPGVIVSAIEKETGLSYTYDLLSHLRTTHPELDFTLVLGSDAAA